MVGDPAAARSRGVPIHYFFAANFMRDVSHVSKHDVCTCSRRTGESHCHSDVGLILKKGYLKQPLIKIYTFFGPIPKFFKWNFVNFSSCEGELAGF